MTYTIEFYYKNKLIASRYLPEATMRKDRCGIARDAGEWQTFFDGYCKNKSELKRIMQQTGIINE